MLKLLRPAALALLGAALFAACDNDDEPERTPAPELPPAARGAYVVTQGNQRENLPGEIDYIALDANNGNTSVSEMFAKANDGQQLGDTPQKPVIYGAKLYVPVYASNVLWVLDAKTLRILSKVETKAPEAVCGAGRYVFVTNNDGHVTRVDTATFAKSAPLAVGPNPYGIAEAGGKLYIAISDGYNYLNGYVNGYKVAVVDPATLTKEKDIAVGMNPQHIAAAKGGQVYVVCNGNSGYGTPAVYPKVWKVDASAGTAAELADGSLIAIGGDGGAEKLYVVNAVVTDWNTYATTVTAAAYNAATGEKLKDNLLPAAHTPVSPITIDVNPHTGNLFICTLAEAGGFALPGLVMEYKADGTHVNTYATGVQPYGVAFR